MTMPSWRGSLLEYVFAFELVVGRSKRALRFGSVRRLLSRLVEAVGVHLFVRLRLALRFAG
jgi:hypothetical protein